MSIISNACLSGQNATEGFQNDVVTAEDKIMTNWNADGNPNVTYNSASDANLVIYQSAPATLDDLKTVFVDSWNTYMDPESQRAFSTSTIDEICGYWFNNPDCNLIWCKVSSQAGAYMCAVVSDFELAEDSIAIHEGKYWIQYNYNPSGSYFIMNQTVSGGTFLQATLGQYDCGVPSDYGNVFNGYVDRDFSVVDSGKYILRFELKNSKGFIAEDTDNVVVSSGSNEVSITLDPTSSDSYKTYSAMIEADDDKINVKFDLSTMVNASGQTEVNLIIKASTISLYPIGDPTEGE